MQVDLGTGLALLGAAHLVERLLGPTAAYIGEGMKDWTEKKVENVRRIVGNAIRFLGDRLDEPGGIAPRVLSSVIQEGQYVEDELMSEYFGGVLASARTPQGRDDRGASLAKLIAGLDVYQLRGHYIFYSCLRKVYPNQPLNVGSPKVRAQHLLFVPMDEFVEAMAFGPGERINDITADIAFGLARDGLIFEKSFAYGDPDSLKIFSSAIEEIGWVVGASVLGVQLYMWAHGKGGTSPQRFWLKEENFGSLAGVALPESAMAIDRLGS